MPMSGGIAGGAGRRLQPSGYGTAVSLHAVFCKRQSPSGGCAADCSCGRRVRKPGLSYYAARTFRIARTPVAVLLSPAFLQVDNFYPTTSADVQPKLAADTPLQWLGWDYVHSHDMIAFGNELRKRFMGYVKNMVRSVGNDGTAGERKKRRKAAFFCPNSPIYGRINALRVLGGPIVSPAICSGSNVISWRGSAGFS